MAFDLKVWKQQVREKLKGWKPRMQQAGVNFRLCLSECRQPYSRIGGSQNREIGSQPQLHWDGFGRECWCKSVANMIQSWKDESDAARIWKLNCSKTKD